MSVSWPLGLWRGALVKPAIFVFFSWVALVRCSSPSSKHVPRLWRGRDLVVPLATTKVASFRFRRQNIRRATDSFCANANNQVSVGALQSCSWVSSAVFQLVLNDDVDCGAWISLHPSFYPIDTNFSSGTVARARFFYSDLEGEIWIGLFLMVLFMGIPCSWP